MIEIVTFSTEYQNGVIDVILPIQQIEFGIPITLEAQPDLLNIPAFYQVDQGNFWVATSQGKVVGTLGLLDIGNHQGAIRKLFVQSAFRGREFGVAQRLLEALLQWCNTKQLQELYLGTTAQFLAAHRFYEKNDFVEISPNQLPATFPVMKVDTRFYQKIL